MTKRIKKSIGTRRRQKIRNYRNYKNYFMEYFKIDIDEQLNVKTAIKLIKKLIRKKTN